MWIGRRPDSSPPRRDRTGTAHRLRCQRTRFGGINALENDEVGRVFSGSSLAGSAVNFIRSEQDLGGLCLGPCSSVGDRAEEAIRRDPAADWAAVDTA